MDMYLRQSGFLKEGTKTKIEYTKLRNDMGLTAEVQVIRDEEQLPQSEVAEPSNTDTNESTSDTDKSEPDDTSTSELDPSAVSEESVTNLFK